MILFNFTGLSRFCWLPSIRRRADVKGLWFVEARWLGVEAIDKAMAAPATTDDRTHGGGDGS